MANMSKIAFGAKENIPSALEQEIIDEYDILCLDTQEMGWIDKDGNPIISTARTQKSIQVNGVTGLGVENGSEIPSGKSLDEIVKMLVQKAVPPTYISPKVTLSKSTTGTASGNYEAGTMITPNLTATFTQNDAGTLTAISVLHGSTEVGNSTISPYIFEGDSFVLEDETVTFKANAVYESGPVKQNNLGDPDATGQILTGTIETSAFNYVGQRNLFYGTGVGSLPELTSDSIRSLTNKKLNPIQGYSFSIPVSVGQQYILFAYPATLRDVNTIKYEEANDSSMANNFTKTVIDVADARGGENGLKSYKVYSYSMPVPAAATMSFTVTI